jgi:hypothetical protein
MTRIILFIFLNLAFSTVFAQHNEKYFGSYVEFKTGDTLYTFLEKNELKAYAHKNAKTIAILNIAEALIVDTNYADNYDRNHVKPTYYKVKYQGAKAYIHRSCVAIEKFSYPKKQAVFLFRVKEYKEKHKTLHIKELNNKNILSAEFELPLLGETFTLALSNTKGLNQIDRIIEVDYIAEACGENGGISFLSWSPKNFQLIASLISVVDADVYYQDESFVFPADSGGIKGKIIYKSQLYELLDEDTNWFTESKSERTYNWVKGKMVPAFRSELIEE